MIDFETDSLYGGMPRSYSVMYQNVFVDTQKNECFNFAYIDDFAKYRKKIFFNVI